LVTYVADDRYVVVREGDLKALLREVSELKSTLAKCIRLLKG